MYVVSGWCLSNVKASLQEFKPDMTHTTCRISIQQSTSVVFVAFWLVLPFKVKSAYGPMWPTRPELIPVFVT